MITPSLGPLFSARWGLRPPAKPDAVRRSDFQLDPALVCSLTLALSRIQGYEELGLDGEMLRELGALPSALRELPRIQLRVGRALERLACFDDAFALYDQMEPTTLSRLGRVRCFAQLGRFGDAAQSLDDIPFDASAVKELVEARDLLG